MPTSAAYSKRGFTLIEVLMSLLIIAVLAALLSRILQISLLTNQIMKEDLAEAPARQKQIHLQLVGELQEDVLILTPIEEDNL